MNEPVKTPEPVLPFWFRQRQGKCEPAGAETFRLTAPNQQEAFISVRKEPDGNYRAVLRVTAEGPEAAVAEDVHGNEEDAWGAAFELYRTHVIV